MSRKSRKPQPPEKPPAKRKSRARPTAGEQAAVKLALDLKGGAKPLGAGEPEQLDIEDLLGLPKTQALTDLRAGEPKVGRPKGALNKRTTEWAEFLLARYASPLEVLAQIANAKVGELVASLGCTKLEALQEKRFAAIALAPFLHSKQPIGINLENRSIVHLTISDGGEFEFGGGAGLTATVIEGKPNGASAEPLLEPARADVGGLHARDQARADPQRADRLG